MSKINAKCGPLYKVQWKTASSQGEGFATLTKSAGWKFHYPADLAQTNGKMVGGQKVYALREATWEDVLFFRDQFLSGFFSSSNPTPETGGACLNEH